MADVKRWSVTYTKHVKQKRKVYQDGFLELQISTNKLLLYDDCEKLLECRLVKNDEVVSSGETLTFNAYLVDVDAVEKENAPPPASDSLRRDDHIAQKNNLKRPLSPSHKIIKDFKKRELRKYGTTQIGSPETTKSCKAEWEVLYTTQVTQKAKKFHDGFLKLVIHGSLGRQIILFDASRNNLDSRFLKKDEEIESGETITFDAHLVQIGEYQGDHISSKENNNIAREKGTIRGQHDSPYNYINKASERGSIKNESHKPEASHSSGDATESSTTEWQVLYTPQVTQKAKKYHDGFLQIAFCGSRGRQIMLYDTTRKLLTSRFLKQEEIIETGVSLAFGTHLVEVGEAEESKKPQVNLKVLGNNCNLVREIGKMQREQDCTFNSSIPKGKLHKNACSKKDAESSMAVPMNKPLRDANQILSILHKSRSQIAAGYKDNSTNRAKPPLVSDPVILDVPEDDQPPKPSFLHHQASENADDRDSKESIDLEKQHDLLSFKALSSGSDSQIAKATENGDSNQNCSDNSLADRDGVNASNVPSSTSHASSGPVDDEKKSAEDLTCTSEMDEDDRPSFDLGF
ncbi:hypothetical protein UlMin_002602 [Ulmus minor]